MNDFTYHLIKRSTAKKHGLQKYFTAKPCTHGHIDLRFTISGKCVKCQKIQSKAWNSSHPEYFEKWSRDNPNWKAEYFQRDYKENYAKWLLKGIKARSKARGIICTLQLRDIKIPTHCPVLGTELKASAGSIADNSPSVDRLIPELGYVPDNIIVVSAKANRIKSNANIEEIKMVYDFYKEIL